MNRHTHTHTCTYIVMTTNVTHKMHVTKHAHNESTLTFIDNEHLTCTGQVPFSLLYLLVSACTSDLITNNPLL